MTSEYDDYRFKPWGANHCVYCGRRVLQASESLGDPSAVMSKDHIVPTSRGGDNAWDNCVLCCKGCNELKGDMTGKEFRHYLITGEFLDSYKSWIIERTMLNFNRNFQKIPRKRQFSMARLAKQEEGDDQA